MSSELAKPRPGPFRSGRSLCVGVDGPRRHRSCKTEAVADLRQGDTSVDRVIRIGMDTSKHIFQLHGVNAAEVPVLRKKLRRKEMMTFFERLVPTVIAIEACGASHHWARLLQSLGLGEVDPASVGQALRQTQ